jgi:hypothetical protein
VSTGVALYYPYIHILDEEWLKQALLFWESIRRIVPDNFQPFDGPDIAEASEANLIQDTSPTPYLNEARIQFREKVPALMEEVERRNRSVDGGGQLNDFVNRGRRLHVEKLDQSLRDFFAEHTLGQLKGDWIVTHPLMHDCYVSCLATVMSQKIGSPPVTNSDLANSFGEYLAHASPQCVVTIPGQGTAMLRLRIPFPDSRSLRNVPLTTNSSVSPAVCR